MIFILYKLLPRHCSLLHNQIYPILSPPKPQQVIGTNREIYKRFQHYYLLCRCTGLSKQCTFGLDNRLAGSFSPATELEINMFWPLTFRELVLHLITHVNHGILTAEITVFDPRRDKRRCFIPCLVYALVYPIIASNHVTLATLSPWYDSICTHT